MDKTDIEDLHEDIARLTENIRELNGELASLSIALKGSSSLKIVGVFEKLEQVENANVLFQLKTTEQFIALQKNMETRFEAVRLEQTLLEKSMAMSFNDVRAFKVRIETYFNMISSKIFWRVVAALFIGGGMLIAWSKGGYDWIVKIIKHLI